MESIDLVERLIPDPSQTLVIETPTGEMVLVDTGRTPRPGDQVLINDTFSTYREGRAAGVAYCSIKFL